MNASAPPATKKKPWYKEGWIWFLCSGPIIVVIAGFITLSIAINSFDGMVSDDYYKQGNQVNQKLEKEQQATKLGIEAQLMMSQDNKTMRIQFSANTPTLGNTLTLKLIHPSEDNYDQTLVLSKIGSGSYQGVLPTLPTAPHWYVQVEDPSKTWRIKGNWITTDPESNLELKGI